MSTDLVPHRASMPDKLRFAEQLANADMLPNNYRRKPGNVLLAVEYGEMLDVHPLTAIQQVHVIDGKLSMSAELMRSMVRRAGHKFRVIRNDAKAAEVCIVRADDPEYPTTVTFTMDDAKAAKLEGKDNWKKYPAAMLLARATSSVVRAACPEVLMGISYVPEELGAEVDGDGTMIVAEVVEAEKVDPLTWATGLDPAAFVALGAAKSCLLDACDGDRIIAGLLWADRTEITGLELANLVSEAQDRRPDDGGLVSDDHVGDTGHAADGGDAAEGSRPDDVASPLTVNEVAAVEHAGPSLPASAPADEGAGAGLPPASAPPKRTPAATRKATAAMRSRMFALLPEAFPFKAPEAEQNKMRTEYHRVSLLALCAALGRPIESRTEITDDHAFCSQVMDTLDRLITADLYLTDGVLVDADGNAVAA